MKKPDYLLVFKHSRSIDVLRNGHLRWSLWHADRRPQDRFKTTLLSSLEKLVLVHRHDKHLDRKHHLRCMMCGSSDDKLCLISKIKRECHDRVPVPRMTGARDVPCILQRPSGAGFELVQWSRLRSSLLYMKTLCELIRSAPFLKSSWKGILGLTS